MQTLDELVLAAESEKTERIDAILRDLDEEELRNMRKLLFRIWSRLVKFTMPTKLHPEALEGLMGVVPLEGDSEPLSVDPRSSGRVPRRSSEGIQGEDLPWGHKKRAPGWFDPGIDTDRKIRER